MRPAHTEPGNDAKATARSPTITTSRVELNVSATATPMSPRTREPPLLKVTSHSREDQLAHEPRARLLFLARAWKRASTIRLTRPRRHQTPDPT